VSDICNKNFIKTLTTEIKHARVDYGLNPPHRQIN